MRSSAVIVPMIKMMEERDARLQPLEVLMCSRCTHDLRGPPVFYLRKIAKGHDREAPEDNQKVGRKEKTQHSMSTLRDASDPTMLCTRLSLWDLHVRGLPKLVCAPEKAL